MRLHVLYQHHLVDGDHVLEVSNMVLVQNKQADILRLVPLLVGLLELIVNRVVLQVFVIILSSLLVVVVHQYPTMLDLVDETLHGAVIAPTVEQMLVVLELMQLADLDI